MNLYAYLDDDLVSMHLSERLLSFESEVTDMSVKVYICTSVYMGLFINYVVSAGGEEGNPKYDLIDRLNLVKKTTRGGQKSSILRRHSLWRPLCI